MADLAEQLRLLEPFVFVLVAVATLRRWVRQRDDASRWAATLFMILSTVVLAAVGLGDEVLQDQPWIRRLLISVLLLFPFVLLRFAGAFEPWSTPAVVVAAMFTVLLIASVWMLPDVPGRGEPRDGVFSAFVIVTVALWTVASMVVARRLWRSRLGRPRVVRLRMQTLSAGVVLLAVALLVSGSATSAGHAAVRVVVALLVLSSAPLFLAGLAPPPALLARWRRPEDLRLRAAEAELVTESDPDAIAGALLPHVLASTGSTAALLVDRNGAVTAQAGDVTGHATDAITSIPLLRGGRLELHGDAYTPFFGREETTAAARLAELTDLAISRAEVARSERLAARDVQRAHDAMRDFIGVASHDLRTPISLIKGYSGALCDHTLRLDDGTRHAYAEVIARQADHLARLVNDLLTVSQLDSDAIDPDIERLALGALVDEVVADLNASTSVCCDVDAGLEIHIDREHAHRILRNVIENALVHGDPPVDVTAAAEGMVCTLVIRDHGPGIPAHLEPRLFERFARADRATNRTKHGTGLGLSIVQGLAQANHGDVRYEPASPGARFIISIPRATP